MTRCRTWLLAAATMALAAATEVAAQSTTTVMRVPGIDGESTLDRYRGWIDLTSLTQSWGPERRRGSPCAIEVAKRLDAAGPPLWMAAVTGQLFGEVTIDVLRTGEGPQRTFQVKLTNARIATIATSTTTDQLAEHLTLAAETSTLSYWPQRPDGSLGPPVAATVACDGR